MYLLTSQVEHTSNECCEFPQQLVCRTISEATFKVKEPGSYFPMVSRHGMVSFFGTPPDPVVIMPLPTTRSEEHTSELQSLMRISYAVFCLKKKTEVNQTHTQT